jgi:hypothetical protein
LKLGAVGVVGAGHNHIGACANELLVQYLNHLRVLEDRFRHEGASLQHAPALQFENIAFSDQHGACFQPLRQGVIGHAHGVLHFLGVGQRYAG